MSALRRDLFGRRLWPVVVILLVAIVAVPLVLRKDAHADVAAVPPAPPLAGAAKPAKHTPARPSVSPLPLGTRDPFASGVVKATTQPAPSQTTASVTAPSTATASTTTTSPAVVSPAPTSPSPSPATTTTTTTTTTVAALPVAPTHGTWTLYRVDLRVGTGSFAPLRTDVPRLTPLPSVAEPKAMFMGVMAGGTEAVFALGAGTQHAGPGLCRPDRTRCAAIVLRAGQTEQIEAPVAGGPRRLNLRLVDISSEVTHSRDVALAAFHRYSAAGLCELDLADPVTYSQGTVSAVVASVCRAQQAAVPFPGGLSPR